MAYIRNVGKVASRLFKNHPLISNSVIYGSLYMTAELMQQTALKTVLKDETKPEPPYDFELIARYGTVSAGAIAPVLYYWYRWLDGRYASTATRVVLKKCLMDQFLVTPNLVLIFYAGMSFLEGKEDLLAEFKAKFGPTFLANMCFWLPTQALNFTYMPPKYRIVFISFCTLIWVNILCVFKRQ